MFLQAIANLKNTSDSKKKRILDVFVPILQAGDIPTNSIFRRALKKTQLDAETAIQQIGVFVKFRENSRKR